MMAFCKQCFLRGDEKLFLNSAPSDDSFIFDKESWDFYIITGYKHATNSIIEYFKSYNSKLSSMHISILYPLAYLHRHQIELRMKYIYRLYTSIFEKEDNLKGHCLESIWNECENRLTIYFDKKFIVFDCCNHHIRNIIEQLDLVDPDGQGFRYSIDSRGQQALKFSRSEREEYFTIDIIKFHNTLSRLENLLEVISDYLIEDYAEKFNLSPDLP